MPTHVTTVEAGKRRVSRRVEVHATPPVLWALLSDPRRHQELDGSGTVEETVKGPDHLAAGDRFSVKMRQYGVPYRITSRVTAADEGRVLEWRHPLGHRWRWELAPSGTDATTVTETFDYHAVPGITARGYELLGIPKTNAKGIEETLSRLAARYP